MFTSPVPTVPFGCFSGHLKTTRYLLCQRKSSAARQTCRFCKLACQRHYSYVVSIVHAGILHVNPDSSLPLMRDICLTYLLTLVRFCRGRGHLAPCIIYLVLSTQGDRYVTPSPTFCNVWSSPRHTIPNARLCI